MTDPSAGVTTGRPPTGFVVDTSVFQAFLRRRNPELSAYIDRVRRDVAMCITPVLEGEYKFAARSPAEWATLDDLCSALVDIPTTREIGAEAVSIIDDLGTEAHMFGAVQITDALIASAALLHDLEIVHNDRDYEHIATVRPDLRQTRIRL
ncbi:PIN domain-containing protein [Tsukamurella soli]|uniref:PIN domain-containing protein n=1 Tax=Tsukamurella soli TaxID=644556 RepID=A0ABP8JX66_9ACTN